jgi:hypothetical protein
VDPTLARIDANAFHGAQIDNQATVASGVAGSVVTAAAQGHDEIVCARKLDALHHICDTATAGNYGRPFVDHAIPDFASLLVAFVFRTDQLAAEAALECRDRGFVKHDLFADQGCRTV